MEILLPHDKFLHGKILPNKLPPPDQPPTPQREKLPLKLSR